MPKITPRIVILGGGFAGAFCARQLEKRLRGTSAKITLVNGQNHFVFTPMLLEAATSALEPRHVVIPLRGFLNRADFIMAGVESVDLEQKSVRLQPDFGDAISLPYDHLVLALGSVTRLPSISGLNAFGFPMKTMSDAMALRDRAIGMLEMANSSPTHEQRRSWLTFAVVGAGYTGVEAAGEFNQFLREAIRQYPRIEESDIHVMLIQRADRILEMLDPKVSAKAAAVLAKAGVDIRLNDSICKMDGTSFTLESGETISSHTLIWSAGVSPPPLLQSLDLPKTARGYLQCDTDLRVTGSDHIWGVGDCASNPDPEGHPYPPTAQHGLREGRQAADNIAAVLNKQPTQPLTYRSKGSMAPLGGQQAIANVFGFH